MLTYAKRSAAQAKQGVPVDQQRLVFSGRVLDSTMTMEHSGVKQGCAVYLVPAQNLFGVPVLLPGGKFATFQADSSTTASMLANQISSATGMISLTCTACFCLHQWTCFPNFVLRKPMSWLPLDKQWWPARPCSRRTAWNNNTYSCWPEPVQAADINCLRGSCLCLQRCSTVSLRALLLYHSRYTMPSVCTSKTVLSEYFGAPMHCIVHDCNATLLSGTGFNIWCRIGNVADIRMAPT